jgi:xylan 1,4-beta-xylosidase
MAKGVRGNPDISALASIYHDQVYILLWPYHDGDLPGLDADVEVTLDGPLSATSHAGLTQYRIDADHSNSCALGNVSVRRNNQRLANMLNSSKPS